MLITLCLITTALLTIVSAVVAFQLESRESMPTASRIVVYAIITWFLFSGLVVVMVALGLL